MAIVRVELGRRSQEQRDAIIKGITEVMVANASARGLDPRSLRPGRVDAAGVAPRSFGDATAARLRWRRDRKGSPWCLPPTATSSSDA